MARRTYTDEDRARVRLHLELSQGNVKRTARETGIPITTVREWKRAWEEKGVPEPVAEAAERQAGEFAERAEHARDIALEKWIEQVNAGTVSARDLMVGIGILTDKLNLAKGLATNRTEQVKKLELPKAEELADFAQAALAAARTRAIEIDEADIRELPPGEPA